MKPAGENVRLVIIFIISRVKTSIMKLLGLVAVILFGYPTTASVIRRSEAQFKNGQPIDANGKGGRILGICGFRPTSCVNKTSAPQDVLFMRPAS